MGGASIRLQQAVQVHDDIFHRGIIHRALGSGAPGGFGTFVIGEDADNIQGIGINEIHPLRIGDAATKDEMQLAHGSGV
jgi:hypothetical protein